MERAFSPYLLNDLSPGAAPGWYGNAPSALKLQRNQVMESAEGALNISLGQHPRKDIASGQRAEGPFYNKF